MPAAEPRMSTDQKDQNALAARLSSFWGDLKQGKIISYKWMAILLIAISAIGVTWYILSERSTAVSQRWVDEAEANTRELQEKISEKYPGTIQDRIARLQVARNLLHEGTLSIVAPEAFTSPEATPLERDTRTAKARETSVANIEEAREMFRRLLDDFKNDPVIKAECLLALAKAEAALVAVPTSPGQLIEFKGKISTVVEYLDQLSEAAAPDTPWATDSKKLADQLRNEQSPSADEFRRIQRSLFDFRPVGTEFK
jgi:hypothetical protein